MYKEIEVKFGYTLNMGNYESTRFDIGLKKDVKMETDQEILRT